MARAWLSIRVDLVEGRGERLWPRPGRILAAARGHSFAALATAIDDAFARWDQAHLHVFRLEDGTRLTTPYGDDDAVGEVLDDRRTRLSRLRPGEQSLYTFDLGDDWTHLCTVGPERIDPVEVLGALSDVPLPSGAGGRSPTSTAGAGTATTARGGRRGTRAARTCRRCARGGERGSGPYTPSRDQASGMACHRGVNPGRMVWPGLVGVPSASALKPSVGADDVAAERD